MAHHGDGHLLTLTKNRPLVEQLKNDYRQADLSERDRTMLDYCVKLTLEPWHMAKEDVQRLRQAGHSDRDILDMNMISGYYAFANRLIDGLGIEVEEFFIKNVIEKEDS